MDTKIVERIGIHKVALNFLENYGWIEREQYVADYGIDTQIEIVENGIPTGLLFCIQVKSGQSYIKIIDDKIVFYLDQKHRDYWVNHLLPVIFIIYDNRKDFCYWEFVNNDTLIQTENGWKLQIPLINKLSSETSKKQLKGYYFNNDNFTIMESSLDTSHALSRRIAMKVIIKNSISDIILENQIPSLIEGVKKSDYYRSKIVEEMYRDTPADCVWIWFYKDFDQYTNGLPYCIAYWNDPKSKSPTILSGKDKKIGEISINYSQTSIPTEFLNRKLTKGSYIKIIDNYIEKIQEIMLIVEERLSSFSTKMITRKDLVLEFEGLKEQHDLLLTEEFHNFYEPLECSSLDQVVQNINATIDNIFIIVIDEKRDDRNVQQLVKIYVKSYYDEINPLKYERKKVI